MQLTKNTSGIILDGKEGTWEVFDQITEMGIPFICCGKRRLRIWLITWPQMKTGRL